VKRAKKKKLSEAQLLLSIHLKELGIRTIVPEFQFDTVRKWRADIALPDHQILIECDGGIHSGGHKRGVALEDDYDKQNLAQFLGWRFLRFSNAQVLNGDAKKFIAQFFEESE
jgi:very-short-patch-repair endonuclease